MNKIKKALIGTALTGSLVVGVGFGTYSWFTDSAKVTGEVTNSVVELNASDNSFTFVPEGNLAPSRSKVSNWVKIDQGNTTEERVRLKSDFTAKLVANNEEARIANYRSGAVVVFNSLDEPVFDKRYESAINDYIQSGDRTEGALINFLSNIAGLLGADFGVEVIKITPENMREMQLLEIRNRGVMAVGYIEGIAAGNSPSSVPDGNGNWVTEINYPNYLDEVITNATNVHLLFGTYLTKESGNEYQEAEYSVTFDFESSQVDRVFE